MSSIKVGCGLFAIYAGSTRERKDGSEVWGNNRTEVTEECLFASLQYLLMNPDAGVVGTYEGKRYRLKTEEVKE